MGFHEGIVGHQKQQTYLRAIAKSDRIPQALIFSGPSEIGKFLVAQTWANELIFERSIDELPSEMLSIHSDRLELVPETVSQKGVARERDIPVEALRDILKQAALSPSAGKRRVLLIRDAHRLTEKSQNALLKTLEEPPKHLIIILITHRIGRLLPTVLSRCQVIDFLPVEGDLLRPLATSAVPELLLSLGRPGFIARFLENPAKTQKELDDLERLLRIEAMTVSDRLRFSEELSKDAARMTRLLEWWLLSERNTAFRGTDITQWRRVALIDALLRSVEQQSKSVRILLDQLFLEWSIVPSSVSRYL